MKLHLIESDSVYRELLTLPVDQRDAVFKEKLLLPFKEKFAIQRISFDERIPFNVMTLMKGLCTRCQKIYLKKTFK